MKHIGFDESTVLREFAKIASEKGLIKQASEEDDAQMGGGPRAPLMAMRNALRQRKNPMAAGVNALNDYYAGLKKARNPRAEKLAQRAGALMVDFLKTPGFKNMVGARTPEQAQQLNAAVANFEKEIQKIWTPETGVARPVVSSVENENVKMADEKHYDVTGETGEDLVEKAHPGGGTETELTHSKNVDNLVETIVEQQKKNIEIVNKMPKGTYAALLNLADRLDKMGYVKAADRVDKMLKKKTAAPEGEEFKRQVLEALQDAELGGRFNKPMVLREWQGISMPTITEGMMALSDLASRWGQNAPDLVGAVRPVAAQWRPFLQAEKQMLAQKQQDFRQQQTGVAGKGQERDPNEPELVKEVPKKRKRLNMLQNRLRRMVGLQPKENQPFDRQLALVLRKNYPDAWQAVKNKAGLKAIFDAVQGQKQGVATKEQVTPPAPPAAPNPAQNIPEELYGAARQLYREVGPEGGYQAGQIQQLLEGRMRSGMSFDEATRSVRELLRNRAGR